MKATRTAATALAATAALTLAACNNGPDATPRGMQCVHAHQVIEPYNNGERITICDEYEVKK